MTLIQILILIHHLQIKKRKAESAKVTPVKKAKQEESPKKEESESGESDSDSDSEESNEKEKSAEPKVEEKKSSSRKKRKIEQEEETTPKKAKVESETSTVFIGGLSYNSTEETIRYHFKDCGEIAAIRVAMRDGKPRGFAHIDFQTGEGAQEALKLTESELDGRTIRCEITESKRQSNHGGNAPSTSNEGSSTVFVGNMSFKSNEDSLRSFFDQYGSIQQIRIPTQEDGRLKGFAYVQYSSPEEAKAALELNGTDIDGRNVRLDLANESRGGKSGGDRGDRGERSGGRGFGRGFGRGDRSGGRGDRGGYGRGDRSGGRGDRGGFGRGDRGGGRGRGGAGRGVKPEGKKITFED